MKHKFTLPDKIRRVTSALFLGIILPLFLGGCGFLPNGLQPPATATQIVLTPTFFVPTADCGASTLLLGSSTIGIETIQPGVDGTLAVPLDKSGTAYWIEGTDRNYVFVLSPTPENLAILPTLTAGSPAKVTWANCNSTSYNLAAPEQGSFGVAALPDQSTEGLTIFFQSDASGAGFVLRGELIEEQISTFNTAVPGAADIQAEISLLETTTAPDGVSIRVGVSIQNYGGTAFTLSGTDVSLTQPDGTPVGMLSSEPPLPKEVAPGTTETVYFFFYRPASQTATLKLLTVEYELEGY